MITSETQLVYVPITQEMRDRAKEESTKYDRKLINSIREGKGTFAGCLGEEMFHKIFPFMIRENTFQYDFSWGSDKRGKVTFDIKTKERTVPPKIFYECSVNTMNGKQDVDYYVFAQVMDNYEYGWLLGLKRTESFFKQCTYHPEGSLDSRNNFRFHCDTYNMEISKLRQIHPPEIKNN